MTRSTEDIAAMRCWLEDCGVDLDTVDALTDGEVVVTVAARYEGGLAGWDRDSTPHAVGSDDVPDVPDPDHGYDLRKLRAIAEAAEPHRYYDEADYRAAFDPATVLDLVGLAERYRRGDR